MSFAHLHVHTEYSLLDGFSNIRKLVDRVRELDMPAIAITDHGTMFGVIDFYQAAMAAGVKPIIGMEAYLASRGMQDRDSRLDRTSSHLLLLAENETGYKNLLQIATAAQLEGFYYFPRIDREYLAAHSEGLICTSGCMSAEIPRALLQDNPDEAVRRMNWYYDVFGPERFFLELQQHDIREITELNRRLVELGARYSAQFVATNDVHYINPEDWKLQDILLAIQTNTVLTDPGRMRMTDPSYYLRPPQEMMELFREVPEALSNTLLIAERCNLSLGFQSYHLPEFAVPAGLTVSSYLRSLCEAGLERRYAERASGIEVRTRLDHELNVIHEMGFDAYFLIVWDLCRHAHENGIWYNARGSAAGSIVAYALDITIVDPLQHGLIFERFLNPGRIEMPDIDLDFRDDRRAQMLEYCANKYGHDRVAQIITFGTMGAKAALRDVGRVMDIPLPEVDRLAKLVPFVPGRTVTLNDARQVPEFKQVYESQPHMRELVDIAQRMEGAVRSAGTHAAGVVISDRPLIEYLPLHRPTSGAEETPIRTVTQFEMNMLGSLGLLKVDFLGLATLTTMARACDLIQQRHGRQFDLGNIPLDDSKAFELLGNGQTLGVFQVEGSGMTRWLLQMKPKTLDHVIAMVALFRPGPMQFIPDYIARMHGEAEVEYLHESLKPIFGETFGIPVYQEQLMTAAVKLGGYTPAEADDLRKAISKKIADKLLKHREKFVKGAVGNGIPVETANQIFTDWEEFARYGFNKSHSADYGVLAVQTAFLKAHYPAEYMAALLSVTRHETEKVALYVAEARTLGVPVLQPDINASDWDFTIADADGRASIRFGLGAIKNVGEGSVKTILSARKAGPFTSLNDFARRVDLRGVGKRALECLIKVGALDTFGDRAGLLESLDRVVMASASHFRAADAGQMSLFEGVQGATHEIHITNNLHIDRREMLNWERELVGLYISAHPLTEYQPVLAGWVTHFSAQLQEAAHEERARVAGLITAVRPYVTKQGKPMGFVTLEDIQGNIELLLFPRLWKDAQPLLEKGKIVFVEGKIDTQSSPPKVLVDSIKTEISMLVPPPGLQPAAEAKSRPAPRAGGTDALTFQVRETSRGQRPPSRDETKPRGQTVVAKSAEEEPPVPENFPEGWEKEWQPGFEHAAVAAKSDAMGATERVEDADGTPAGEPPRSEPTAAAAQARPASPALTTASAGERTRSVADSSGMRIPAAYGQSGPQVRDEERRPQQITVLLRASGDIERDKRRIKTIHGTLISFHGRDRFSFQIYENGKGHLIDFPNETTRICSEMLDRLQKLLGDKTWRVEEITLL